MKNLLAALLFLVSGSGWAQVGTLIPLPAHDSLHIGTVDGYWFEAPIDFTITNLSVSRSAGWHNQFIHLIRIDDAVPVVFPATSTNFTTLAYLSNETPWSARPVGPIQVKAGDIIGVLGAVDSAMNNSLSSNGSPYTSDVGTFGVSLRRLTYQGSIETGPALHYSAQGSGTPIGRMEIYYVISPSCPSPSGLMASNILSTSATLSWPAISGSQGYDYIVSTSPTNPTLTVPYQTTTNTSVNATGLTPATDYFLYIRNKCSGSVDSRWEQLPFRTHPPCDSPVNFKTRQLSSTTATIDWDLVPAASSYDYVVNLDPSPPLSGTGWTTVNAPPVNLTGLTENTLFYVHLRSNCAGGEISSWMTDSFMTPIPCRQPKLKLDNISVYEAVFTWDPVPSAISYEYALTRQSTPPVLGTDYLFTGLHMSALDPGADYYIHVRSFCLSNGTESYSLWTTEKFTTWKLGLDALESASPGIEVYPSPVADQAKIEIHGLIPRDGKLELLDLMGQVLESIPVGTHRLMIPMADRAPGWY